MAGLRGACSLATLPSAAEGRRAERNPFLGGRGHGEGAAGFWPILPPLGPSQCTWLAPTGRDLHLLQRQTSHLRHPGKHLHLTDLYSVLLLYPSIQQTLPGGLLLLGQLGHGRRTTKRTLALVELVSE